MPTEDQLYRASTQYRLWNFTPEKLASLRVEINTVAAKSVRAAIKRKRAAKAQTSPADVNGTASDADGNDTRHEKEAESPTKIEKAVECLTPEEEKKLVDFYCSNMLQMGVQKPLNFPINVAGTAVQFLKRFYLSHSPMDYHPKQIMPAALFLATKTENYHTPLKSFVENLKSVPGLNKLTAEDILAPEFILTQGLRFCFDVRHPHRGLKGFYLECKLLDQIVNGSDMPTSFASQAVDDVRRGILHGQSPQDFLAHIDNGYAAVKEFLNSSALLSDSYFLYTPSQILFAAWHLYDPQLIKFYIDMKMQNNEDTSLAHVEKIHQVIRDCAALLLSTESQINANEDRQELTRIDKKLFRCRNPEKLDLISLNKAQKRDAGEDGKLSGQVAKKRKLAREKSEKEGEELFGPDLVRPKPDS